MSRVVIDLMPQQLLEDQLLRRADIIQSNEAEVVFAGLRGPGHRQRRPAAQIGASDSTLEWLRGHATTDTDIR